MFSSSCAVGESTWLALQGLDDPLESIDLGEWTQTKAEKPSAACPYDSMATLVNPDCNADIIIDNNSYRQYSLLGRSIIIS